MASDRILTREPFLIDVTGVAGDVGKVEMYIHNINQSVPATPQIVQTKTIPSSLTDVYFNISPFLNKYIEHVYFEDVTAAFVAPEEEYTLVTVKKYLENTIVSTTVYYAFYGWNLNPTSRNQVWNTPKCMLDDGEYFVKEVANAGALYVDCAGVTGITATYTNINTGAVISVSVMGSLIYKLPYVASAAYAQGGNVLTITNGATVLGTYTFKTKCNPKYDAINCDFVNKWGVWQRLILFGASRKDLETKDSTYQFMSREFDGDLKIGTKRSLNKNGRETFRLNTGLVEESYTAIIKQLLMSETILIDNVPVTAKKKSTELFKNINTKQINYSLEFEESNTVILTGL